ncbi:MAG: hypothetical protein ACFBSD_05705 [Paracoccaceae bacterium]
MRSVILGLTTALCLAVATAQAAPVRWTLDGLVDAGGEGQLTGSFIFNAMTGTFSETQIEISGSVGGAFDAVLTEIVGGSATGLTASTSATPMDGDPGAFIVLSGVELTDAGGTVPVSLFAFGTCGDLSACSGISGPSELATGNLIGAPAAIPLPAGLPLLLGAIGVVAGLRLRRG